MTQQTNPAASQGRKLDREQIRKLTLAAMLTAVVVVLALLGTAIKFGTFNVNLALVPIVIGAALLGVSYGAWFGFVNALVILLSGDAGPFLAVNVFGTIVTVVAKGVLAGLASGAVFRLMQGVNKYAAVILAALICPLVNTGVFLIGCLLFFWQTIGEWAGGANTFTFAIVGLIGVNFLIEVAINIILAPAIARILGLSRDDDTALIVYGSTLTAVGYGFLIFAIVLLAKNGSGADIFSRYSVKTGLNPSQRYFLMALFCDLIRLSGIALIVAGLSRKRTRAKIEAAVHKN